MSLLKNKVFKRKQSAVIELGTANIEIIEGEDMPEKRGKSTYFCHCLVGEKEHYSSTVTRSPNPVWDYPFECVVTNNAKHITIRIVDGAPGANGNKQVGVVTIDLNSLSGAFADEWYDIVSSRRRKRGKLRVCTQLKLSGVSSLLSAVVVTSETVEKDEKESTRELLLAAPELVKQAKFVAQRVVYAIEPLMVFRKQLTELFLWRSKLPSLFAFLIFLYLWWTRLMLSFLSMLLAAGAFWQSLRAMRPNSAYVFSTDMERDALAVEVTRIKNDTRIGGRTSLLTDLRKVLALLDAFSTKIERARARRNDSRDMLMCGSVLLLLALLSAFVSLAWVLGLALRLATLLGGVYMFTLFPLYANFPQFKRQYTTSKLLQLAFAQLKGLMVRGAASVSASSHTHATNRHLQSHNEEELWTMVLRLCDETTGVPCKTRKVSRKKRVSGAFVASEAVDWLYTHMGLATRRESVSLMRAFASIGAIELATNAAPHDGRLSKSGSSRSGRSSAQQTPTTDMLLAAAQHLRRRRQSQADLVSSSESSVSAESSAQHEDEPPTEEDDALMQQWHENSNLFADSSKQLWIFNAAHCQLWRTNLNLPTESVQALADRMVAADLTERDWKLLVTGGELLTYQPGAVVIEQDICNANLFRIETGDGIVERDDDEGHTLMLGPVGAGSMLGELSALDASTRSTARVRAVSAMQVNRMQCSFVLNLFESEPNLCRRFFHTVALRLADRLDGFDKPKGSGGRSDKLKSELKSAVRKAHNLMQTVPSMASRRQQSPDQRFAHLFRVKGEVVISTYEGQQAGKVANFHGRVYVTQRYLAFHGSLFGHHRRALLAYASIQDVEVSDTRIKVILRNKKREKFKMQSPADANDLHRIVTELIQVRDNESARPPSPSSLSRKNSRKASSDGYESESEGGGNWIEESALDQGQVAGDASDKHILSSEDWDVILSCAYHVAFERDEPIITRGADPVGLLYVCTGVCRVERDGKLLGTVESGSLIGEISFLRNSQSTADVVADSAVEINIIPGQKLRYLFVQQPALGGRVMRYLAWIVQERISKRVQAQDDQSNKAEVASGTKKKKKKKSTSSTTTTSSSSSSKKKV